MTRGLGDAGKDGRTMRGRGDAGVGILLALVAGVAAASPAVAQDGAFIARLGTDTVSVERFRFRDGRLEGEVLVRSPRVTLRQYMIQFGPDGLPIRAELVSTTPGSPVTQTPLVRAGAIFGRDSVSVVVQRASGDRTLRVAMPADVMPMVSDWWAGVEAMAAKVRHAGADSVRFHTWEVGAPGSEWMDVVRIGLDSFRIADVNQTHYLRLDAGGRMLRAVRPTQQFVVERVSTPDIEAIGLAWAGREQREGRLAAYSIRDTTRATVAGAVLSVDYGRPSKRDRVIFGGVVPWDQVWRTGANASTQLTTDRELEIGGMRVAAGAYTVTTIPSRAGWTLILSREGTEVARLPMRVESLAQPVEQFTIGIAPMGQGGVLNLDWDTVRASIPFTVR